MTSPTQTLRIFISSPGDVGEERDKARRVIDALQRHYPGVTLQPVLWEDLALPATASFQGTIDFILQKEPIDIAVFILWSRLGSPLGSAITRADGSPYRSGTEREFDVMLEAFEQSGKQRPVILAYTRTDESGFRDSLTKCPGNELEDRISQRRLAESFIREQFKDAEGHNVRAYHSYREPVSFAERLHKHLHQILDELLDEGVAPRWLHEPYRGLEVFDVEHAPIFQGRDEETCDLLQRLRDQEQSGCAFTVIVGASGSGKSSLARAGVAAALTQHAYDDHVKVWRVVTLFPSQGGGDLNRSLVLALAEQLPELRSSATALDDIASGLAKDARLTVKLSIVPAFARSAEAAHGAVRILLLIDQLEELWTDRRITDTDREQFLGVLEALARSGQIAVLATLRSDFYPHAQKIPTFLQLKGDRGHYDLLAPGTAALHRLITEPARLAGLRFEPQVQTGRTLDQLILQDASRDPAALPLLQYALSELYEQRDEEKRLLTFEAYKKMDGVEGALGKRAADTFHSVPPEVQAALPEILPQLVTIDIDGEQSAVRRRASLSSLTDTPNRKTLTEALIAARFLTTDRQDDTPIVSLAHEALLRRWDELSQWVTSNRDHLRLRSRAEQSQQRWSQQQEDPSLFLPSGLPLEEGHILLRKARPLLTNETVRYIERSVDYRQAESRRQRRIRNTALVMSLTAALIAVVAAFWINSERSTAKTEAANAKTQEGIAKEQARIAKAQEAIARTQERVANEAKAKAEVAAMAERQAKELETVARQRSQEAEALTLTSFQESTDDVIEQLIGSKPELGPQERDYLERTLKRWQAFADRQENDELGQMYRAEGHTRVGKIWEKLGKREEAQKAYEEARHECLALTTAFPHNREYQSRLASSLNRIGRLFVDGLGGSFGGMEHTSADLRAAYVASKQARDILRKLVAQFPDDAEYQLELARSHANLGDSEGQGMERVVQVRTEYQRSRQILEALAKVSPKNPVYQQELASNHLRMGGLHSFEFDNQPAELAEYKKAREIQERLVEQHPAVIEYRLQLARILKQLGISLSKRRHWTIESSTLGIPAAEIANRFGLPSKTADAQECFVQTIGIQQGLVDQFPSIPIYRRNLGTTHSSLASFLRGQGDFSEAYRESKKSVEHYEKLSLIVPNGPGDRYALLLYRSEMAQLAWASGDLDAALRESEKTAATLRLLAKEKPLDGGQMTVMNNCLFLMNAIHVRRRHYSKSAAVMDEFATICPLAQQSVFRNGAENYRRQEEQHLVAVEECQNLGRMLDSRVEGETDDDRWERCLYVYSLGVDEPDKNCSAHAAKAMEELRAVVATRSTFGVARSTQKRLAEKYPSLHALPGGYQYNLARCHHELGDLLRSKGEANAAKDAYVQSLEIQQNHEIRAELVKLFPMVPEFQDALAYDLESLSDSKDALYHTADKRSYLGQSRDCRLKLAEQFPAVPEYQARLAACHDKLGRLLGQLGESDLARNELERARDIRLKLVEKYPEVLAYQIDLAYGLHRLGNLPCAPSERAAKRAALEQALQNWQKLSEQFPEEPKYRNLLAGRYNHLGLLLRDIGQEAAARSALEQARDIRMKLVKEYPTVIEYQNDLAYSFHHLGNVLTSLGDSPAARIAHEQARDNWQKLAEQQPAVTEYRIELGGSYSKLGAIAFASGMLEDSLGLYGQSISVLSTGFPLGDRNMQKRRYLRLSYVGRAKAFASLDRHKEAVGDWNQAVSLVPADHETFHYRLDRIESRLRAGQLDLALEELDDLLFLTKWGGDMAPAWTADQWYQFAHLYSLISGSPSDQQAAYSDTALELLKKAVDAGYNGPRNVANMEKDSNMDPLRARADFQQLLKLMLEPSGGAPVIPPPPPEAVSLEP